MTRPAVRMYARCHRTTSHPVLVHEVHAETGPGFNVYACTECADHYPPLTDVYELLDTTPRRSRLTLRVYKVNAHGAVTEDRSEVEVLTVGRAGPVPLTLPFPPLAAIFGTATVIASGLALAAHGLAKWGGADVSWMQMGMDAVGMLPGIGMFSKGIYEISHATSGLMSRMGGLASAGYHQGQWVGTKGLNLIPGVNINPLGVGIAIDTGAKILPKVTTIHQHVGEALFPGDQFEKSASGNRVPGSKCQSGPLRTTLHAGPKDRCTRPAQRVARPREPASKARQLR